MISLLAIDSTSSPCHIKIYSGECLPTVYRLSRARCESTAKKRRACVFSTLCRKTIVTAASVLHACTNLKQSTSGIPMFIGSCAVRCLCSIKWMRTSACVRYVCTGRFPKPAVGLFERRWTVLLFNSIGS